MSNYLHEHSREAGKGETHVGPARGRRGGPRGTEEGDAACIDKHATRVRSCRASRAAHTYARVRVADVRARKKSSFCFDGLKSLRGERFCAIGSGRSIRRGINRPGELTPKMRRNPKLPSTSCFVFFKKAIFSPARTYGQENNFLLNPTIKLMIITLCARYYYYFRVRTKKYDWNRK